jgi:hypothetical protein
MDLIKSRPAPRGRDICKKHSKYVARNVHNADDASRKREGGIRSVINSQDELKKERKINNHGVPNLRRGRRNT